MVSKPFVTTGAISSPRWPTSVIAGVQGALPPNRYSQSEITEALVELPQFAPHADLLRRFHQTAKVNHRHLVLPLPRARICRPRCCATG